MGARELGAQALGTLAVSQKSSSQRVFRRDMATQSTLAPVSSKSPESGRHLGLLDRSRAQCPPRCQPSSLAGPC